MVSNFNVIWDNLPLPRWLHHSADVISETYKDTATGKRQIRRFQRPHAGVKTSQQETLSNIYE